MDEGQVTPIAGGVKRGRGFGEVIADDARVADLLVAEGQLVVRETDRAGVVRELRVLQRARVERNGARLLAAGERNASVQAPQGRELRFGNPLAVATDLAAVSPQTGTDSSQGRAIVTPTPRRNVRRAS